MARQPEDRSNPGVIKSAVKSEVVVNSHLKVVPGRGEARFVSSLLQQRGTSTSKA